LSDGASFWRYWVADPLAAFPKLLSLRLLRLLPTKWCSLIGARFGAMTAGRSEGFHVPTAETRALWLRLNPGASEAAADRAMARARKQTGRFLTEYAILDRLWAEGRVSVEGAEHVERIRAEGRRLIVATIHLANYELVGPVLMGLGHPPVGLYEPPANRFIHAAAVRIRESYGGEVIPPSASAARASLHVLKERKLPLVIFIDDLTNGRIQAPAFGRRLLPESNLVKTVKLAALADAEIVVGYALRTEAVRFRFIFTPPLPLHKTGNKANDLALNVEMLNGAIETIIKDHLDQWYLLPALRLDEP
jgi:KDO2-lipid IV(A) lauroyltransferase